jgi:hypothetical protein
MALIVTFFNSLSAVLPICFVGFILFYLYIYFYIFCMRCDSTLGVHYGT